jgi:SAM-dependent methyltransferase
MPQEEYVLQSGAAGNSRLEILDKIFGAKSRQLLQSAGLRPGWQVVEIGCGNGLVACWMAERIGTEGSLTAVDISAEQLAVGKQKAETKGISNIVFHEASAYETGLPSGSFDLAYSRFLLCHLQRPLDAVREMRRVVKIGGVIVCEDYDASAIKTNPATPAYRHLRDLIDRLDKRRGVDSKIGRSLSEFFENARVHWPACDSEEVTAIGVESRKFWAMTLREAAPAIVESGVAEELEVFNLCRELEGIALDWTIQVVLTRVWRVWGIKSLDRMR